MPNQVEEDKAILNLLLKEDFSVCDEIRSFVEKHDITRYQIEEMTDLDVRTVNSYFRGQKLSKKSKQRIYTWYIKFSKNPEAFIKAYSDLKTKQQAFVEKQFAAIIDPEQEIKEIQELSLNTTHNQISSFVLENNLKQRQVEEMTKLNGNRIHRSIVSKFLSGRSTKLQTKIQIYKWYFRYSKHTEIYQQAYCYNFESIYNLKEANKETNKLKGKLELITSKDQSLDFIKTSNDQFDDSIISILIEQLIFTLIKFCNFFLFSENSSSSQSQDQGIKDLNISQTRDILDEILLNSFCDDISSQENDASSKKLNTIIDDLKSVTNEGYLHDNSEEYSVFKTEIFSNSNRSKKRSPLQSIGNHITKRSLSTSFIGILFVFYLNSNNF